MSGQLPSPAPSDRRALAEPLSFEDLQAALAEEKIENAKLENKIVQLEAKMEALEKQVRDLAAEPWGKKKARQSKQRKRTREEAKMQKAIERGGKEPPVKKALLSAASPAAPEADEDMVDAEDGDDVRVADDAIDTCDPNADDQTAAASEGDLMSSIEPNVSPVFSPISAEKPIGDGGLKAKWKHGMLELERTQEAERAIRSGNPSPLTAASSTVPLPSNPFRAPVSDAPDSPSVAEKATMSLRGGAGKSSTRVSEPYTSKATVAIQELVDYWAKTFPLKKENLQSSHDPTLAQKPYSPTFRGQGLEQARNEQEEDDWPEELDLAGVTIIGEAPQEPLSPAKPVLKFPAARSVDVLREEALKLKNRDHPVSSAEVLEGLRAAKEAAKAAIDGEGSQTEGESRIASIFAKRIAARGRVGKPTTEHQAHRPKPLKNMPPAQWESPRETLADKDASGTKADTERAAKKAAGEDAPSQELFDFSAPAIDSPAFQAAFDHNSPEPTAKMIKIDTHPGWTGLPLKSISFEESLKEQDKKMAAFNKKRKVGDLSEKSPDPFESPLVRSSPLSPLSPKSILKSPSKVKDRPPTPGLRTQRATLRNRRALVDLAAKPEEGLEYLHPQRKSPSTIARMKRATVTFQLLDKADKGKESVNADAELQGDVASQSDVTTWYPVVHDKDLRN
ncbi:hypothetical protein UCRPA7_1500 [Phaeoacremonium minimum UCRPA7]|uniref:Uncharacterized protein n=1 Tax=Phaeoacremonium minimum (strain UCR-PA7) TaxID=1286976 RepID=R8BUF9_PHAM7|nr:hypothetical protein UCRPA7_1500 [Phaeoacremonium minimum UCRPA7]EOO02929.1 hypothetical protein UCRPA7_1500 [Phaeoacremonium minimum UCRPA7]